MAEQQSSHAAALARLAEMEARASKATEGPWPESCFVLAHWKKFLWRKGAQRADEDIQFISHVRTDAPLVYAALRAILEMHAPVDTPAEVSARGPMSLMPVCCLACEMPAPCPTVTRLAQALEGELWLTVNRR